MTSLSSSYNGLSPHQIWFNLDQGKQSYGGGGGGFRSWHTLEKLQESRLKVCKVLGEPTQISEKLELVTKIMFGYHGNNKSADFHQHFSENQQFYLVHAKVINFSFVLSIYTECGNKVACSKDVLRYHLFRKHSVSKKNENS